MNPREGEGHAQISAAVTLVLFCVMIGQGPASAQVGHVKGTATYRERMALPPNAVFEATLEDVSRADAPSEIVGKTRIEGPGNPPIRFEISYDPSRINPKNRYTVRARILVGGRLFFTSDQSYPVLTGGQGNEVEVLLRRAGSGPASGGMDTEKAFLAALSQAKRAKITRQHLELFDASGNVVARFEARHMP